MGDLYVRITVNFPPHIDPSVIGLLEQALPARTPMVMPKAPGGKKFMVDEVTLEEPNDRQRRAAQNGDEMDEDDDERGGPGVQCAQREFDD
jgi:DnaJ family protein A protein 2